MGEIVQSYISQAPAFTLNAFWISQLLIGIALFCDLASWQCKKREHILWWLVISTILIGTHFVLLKEYTGAILIYIATLRFATSIFSTNPKFMWGFFLLVIGASFLTYEKPVDLVALLANLIFNYAAFRPNDKSLRLWTMLGTSIWIFFNIIVFTPAGVALESFFLISNLVGYYRYYINPHKT